jgi:hypothetical protein
MDQLDRIAPHAISKPDEYNSEWKPSAVVAGGTDLVASNRDRGPAVGLALDLDVPSFGLGEQCVSVQESNGCEFNFPFEKSN